MDIPGATNSQFTISNVRPTNSGPYRVRVTNSFGHALSAYAVLKVDPLDHFAGLVDPAFFVSPGNLSGVSALVIAPDEKIVVGGDFSNADGTPRSLLGRLNADGSLDPTFAPATNPNNGRVRMLVLQPDGKILVVGRFAAVPRIHDLARLNSDGTLDPNFQPFGNLTNTIYATTAIALQNDGKILLGTVLSAVSDKFGLFRLHPNGSVDASFTPPPVENVPAIALQADGKNLFPQRVLPGQSRPGVVRLNPNGTLDRLFSPVLDLPDLWNIAVQPDQKVLASGARIYRWNSNGSFDATFSSNARVSEPILVQDDGKILLGGYVSDGYFMRLLPNGTLDPDFLRSGSGFIFTMAQAPNGDIYVGGNFTSLNGIPRSGVARLYGKTLPALRNPELSRQTFRFALRQRSGAPYTIEFKDSLAEPNWRILGVGTLQSTNLLVTDPVPNSPSRFYRVRVDD